MTTTPPDPNASRPGGLFARIRGMVQARKPPVEGEEAEAEGDLLEFDALPVSHPSAARNDAEPEEASSEENDDALPMAEPVFKEEPIASVATERCPACKNPRRGDDSYCADCGFMFPSPDAPGQMAAAMSAAPQGLLKSRYEIGPLLTERGNVARFRGVDQGGGIANPQPVIIVRQPIPEGGAPVQAARAAPVAKSQFEVDDDDEVVPGFDEPITPVPSSLPSTDPIPPRPAFPSVTWEQAVLESALHPSLPRLLDGFAADGYDYLIEEVPQGLSLWDAWDAPEANQEQRFTWLKQIAEALDKLHHAGAILEALRPDIVTIQTSGQARLTDLSDLLPLPLPPDAPIRATLYTAPELASASSHVDARADLYSFGAMLYALNVGRELTEMDFDRPGNPKPFIPFFPDIHPSFGRLVSKTFCRDRDVRFPTDEASKTDPTGFTELIHTLDVCARTLDNVRLEIAAWTTTGMIRTGNEDAFALIHVAESRQDDLGESALLLLADGMGGYEAGEVAAALAIQAMRKYILQMKPFQSLAGGSPFPADGQALEEGAPGLPDIENCKKLLLGALKDANRQVYTASRTGTGRRGMGCTAEIVYLDNRKIVVGHVGDSRTYHFHQGRLVQITRDQTLVERLKDLGLITPEEVDTHPRRNELQQAIGGQPEVEPGLYHGYLKAGDWVVVCSDGVSNHIPTEELQAMLREEAMSADMAARRLVNWVNIRGATDNATVVVVRAT